MSPCSLNSIRAWCHALVLAAAVLPFSAQAAASLSHSSTQFDPADVTRTSMDIGGVWNGTADVTNTTGDTFRFTVANAASPATSAYSFTPTVSLPTGFTYVAGTASRSFSGTGCPGSPPTVAASQAGTTLTFTFTPTPFALPADCSITLSYGLKTATTVAAGTYAIHPTYDYSDSLGGPLVGANAGNQTILVAAGATTLTITPNTQTKAPNATATFTPSVCNTGLGGLFDVTINESGINPNVASSLQISSIVQTAPALPTATGSSPTLTLPYLAPGVCFTATVNATVTGCSGITNPVTTAERTGTASNSNSASVKLDLETPLIAYTPPGVSVPISTPGTFSMSVSNTNLGAASQVALQTSLPSVPAVVSNVSAGWSYNSLTGTFTYIAGTITNAASVTLSFDLEQNQCPPAAGSYAVTWRSTYLDACGNSYKVPSTYSSVALAGGIYPVTLEKTAPSRINLGETAAWALIVHPNSLTDLLSDPITVTDTLPSTATAINVGAAPAGTNYSCPGGCGPGKVITWTIPKSALGGGAITLPMTFTAPTTPCSAGTAITNSAAVTASWGPPGCTFTDSTSASTYLALTPGFTTTQSYNVTNGVSGGHSFETGIADGGNGTREIAAGEGEFIPFENSLTFDGTSPGTWAGSSYTDTFAGLGSMELVPGSLKVAINGGGQMAVPAPSIVSSSGSLNIDLAFLAGGSYVGSPNVANSTVAFFYSTTAPDSALPLPSVYRDISSLGTYNIAGGALGCGGGLTPAAYSQPLSLRIYRRAATIGVSVPSVVDICGPFSVTATTSSADGNPLGPAWNSLVTASTTGSYDFITPQTPVYGGAYSSGNITYVENSGTNPTFTFGPTPLSQGSNGTVTYSMRLRANASTTPAAVGARIDYDDTQVHPSSPPRTFTASGSDTPIIVRKGDLAILATPSTLSVIGNQAQFTIYVVNGGDGVAYNTTLDDVVPAGFTPNQVDTDAANGSYPVSIGGQTMSWSLGNINPGVSVPITVVLDVAGGSCSIPANSVTAKWGCGGTDAQTVSSSLPTFSFPTGSMQALHDSSAVTCSLCDSGASSRDVLIVRNTGLTHIYNISVSEILNPATTGIDIAAGPTFEYSTDGGGSWNPTVAPTGAGTTVSPYVWDHNLVAALSDLSPTTEPGIHEVRIRFPLQANQSANNSPTITMAAAGNVACGSAVSSPGVGFSIPVLKPNMVLTKQGRNITTGSSVADTVYGKPGDVVEWQVSVQNQGTLTAQQVELLETLPVTGTATATLTGPGHAGSVLTSGVAVTLPNIANSSTASYTVTETLGASCVSQNNTAAVTWGCTSSSLTTPTQNTDTAALVMSPSFGGSGITQQWNTLNNGRGEIEITLTNGGAYAQNLVLTDTLFSGFQVDTTFTPTVTGTGNVSAVALGGTAAVPIFTFTGTLDNGKTAVLKFRVLQTTSFDTLTDAFAKPETTGNGKRPVAPAADGNQVDLAYQNGCTTGGTATNTTTLTPLTPYVGTTVTPSTQVVTASTVYNFDFTLTNNGPSGSVADYITFTPNIGGGWSSTSVTVTAAGSGGTGGVCAGTCTAAQLGTLASGSSAVIRFTGTANSNGSAITVAGTTHNTLFTNDGTTTGNDLSYEIAQARVAGYAQSLTLSSTSETFSTTTNVAIGEEQTWLLHAEWFGVDTSDVASGFTSITVRETLPTGIGYVSHAATGLNTASISAVTGNTPVTAGAINFTVDNIVGPATGAVFDVNVITRTLNIAGNTNGTSRTNNLGTRFTLYGTVLASNNGTDGFGGSQSALHSGSAVTVRRPALTFSKQVRNVTLGTGFGTSTNGNAGNVLEYRVQIGNTGTVPAFDITVNDTVSSKLNLADGTLDGGTFTPGLGGSVVYNSGNTTLTAGSSLGQLDGGNTVTLLYQATVDSSANPLEALLNNATVAASSLSGLTGNQTAPTGVSGSGTGELTLSSSSQATNNVAAIGFSKIIVTSAVGSDTSLNVQVGEQVTFRLPVILPEGTTPSLVVSDLIPAGLSLVAVAAPAFGSGITGCNSPVIAPSSLPADGAPLTLSWTFGTCSIAAASSTAQKTVTLEYTVQVRNVAGNVNGTTLTNTAGFTYTGYTSPTSSIVLTVKAPNVTASKVASVHSGVVAGDLITYTVTLSNTGTAPANDLKIIDTLPSGLSYVASSTNVTSGTAFGEPDISGSQVIWGRTQAVPQTIDLGIGASVTYTYQVLVGDTVQPGQTLTNALAVDYTTLSGSPGPNLGVAVGAAGTALGERDGSGSAPNTLTVSGTDSTTVANGYSVVKVASGDTLAPSGFRVGDIVTYTLQINVQKGTANNFRVRDVLPTGLAFVSFDAITPASGAQGYTFTAPAGVNAPSAGATGTINWNLGTLVRSAASAVGSLQLVYRAIVTDVGGIATTPATQTLSNGAFLVYLDASAATQTSSASTSAISAKQPILGTVKALRAGQSTTVNSGSTVTYRVTVTNSGTAPAYNIVVADTLPVGMRVATPATIAVTLNGSTTTLSPPSYSSSTGLLSWTLDDSQPLNAGQTLVIDYDTTVDSTIGGGLTLTNSAAVSDFYSVPAGLGSTDRRHYVATSASTTSVSTPSPTNMGKSVDVSVANIGDTITYTLTIPSSTVNVSLYDAHVTDSIPSGLSVQSITTNAVTLGASLTNISSGNSVDLTFDRIPANQQATVTVVAKVQNILTNVNGVIKSNSASYTWAKVASGATQTAITSSTVTTTLKEPTLAITKVFKSQSLANALQGLQAGDSITYTISLTNTGTGPAYDILISDVGDQRLISPVVSANPDNPGAATNAGTSGGNTTWTWTVPGPLASGASYTFDLQLTLSPAVQPYQNLTNTANTTWASTVGPNPDRRDGSGGAVNTYSAANPSPVTRTTGSVTFTKTESPAQGNYAVGETVTYTLDMDFITGQLRTVHFLDTLPAGMSYVSAVVSTTNAQKLGGGAVAVVSGPSAGATGALDFSLGDVESTGSSPRVRLTLVGRVRNVPGNTNGTALTNVASGQVDNPGSPGTPVTIAAVTNPIIHVVEPQLVLGLDAPATINLATPATATARINNTGTSSAFQPILQVQLPSGMRQADPTSRSITANITGGRTLTLTAPTDFTAGYVPGTGIVTFTFTSAQAYLATTETLTVTFPVSLDSDTTNTTPFVLNGTVTQWSSQDQSGGATPEVRTTTTALGTGTTGTANTVTGDDPTDDASLAAAAPVVTFTKAVSLATTTPGTTLSYTVTIGNSGGTTLSTINFTDDMDASFVAGTLTGVGTVPSSGTLVVLPTGGVNGTGRITISGASVPASGTLVLSYQITLKPVLPSGTVVKNQGRFTAAGYTNPFLSDSTNPADLSGPDHSTRTTITSAPVLTFTKISLDVNGAPLAVSDILTYTVVLTNTGNENVKSAVIQDSIPSNTTYVAGTTTLNGAPVADVSGASPLTTGLTVNGVGDTAGWLNATKTATVTFQVRINTGVVAGTAIRNQARFNGQGEGSGTLPTKLSDDPRTTYGPDPTTDVVGNVPLLYAMKTVTDTNGTPTLAGHVLEYTIVVRNVGATTAHSVVLKDAIPVGATYAPGTILFGAAGSGAAGPTVAQTDAADVDASDFGVTQAASVSVSLGDIDAGFEAAVKFRVTVNVLPNGTVISNQGVITSQELPPLLTDALGILGAPPQPTTIVVGAVAQLTAAKAAVGTGGGVLKPGDSIRYSITLTNVGSVPATNVVLTDPTPPTPTTYSVGSTSLNGVVVPDVSGNSALNAGLLVGTLAPGASAVVEFVVDIPGATPSGTIISNTATYTADAGLSGTAGPVDVQLGAAPGVADLRGRVWMDQNHNRVADPSELGQPGWHIEAVLNGAVVGSATSDSSGNYQILGLVPGSGYVLRFRHPLNNVVFGGATTTAPGAVVSGGTISNITLPAGLTVADQNLPLDPNGVLYDSITRNPIAGAVVSLLGPAGFTPATDLAPGQQGQTTASDGFYRFDLFPSAPAGIYTFAITVPNAYLPFPSTIIAPQAGALTATGGPAPFLVQAQSTAPSLTETTTYYTSFNLNASDPLAAPVVNNHVPIDPILRGAIVLTKTTPLQNVSRGSLVPYTITARNTTTATLSNIDIIDLLPAGFKFIAGSMRSGSTGVTPTQVGRTLTLANQVFTPSETKTYRLVMIVGAGVGEGNYTNEAWALNNIANTEVSNHGTATVRVVADPTFDCAELVGKVFDDKNLDGIQDDGEKGIANVRIATARGLLVTTDPHGRFHIACPMIPNELIGSNFILKIDERTLPSGFRITTENPRVVRLTRGKMSKVNFGATVHRVVRLELRDAAFAKDDVPLQKEWQDKLSLLIPTLHERPSILRLAYWAAADDRGLVRRRLSAVKRALLELWKTADKRTDLTIEEELSWAADGKAGGQ